MIDIRDLIVNQGFAKAILGSGGGSGSANIENKTITENGTYTASDGVDGFNPVTVNVDRTKITILKEQEFSGFYLNENYGYIYDLNDPDFTIEEGKEYIVSWDGVSYPVTAVDSNTFIANSILLGNGTAANLPGNNEPFAIGHMGHAVSFLAFTDPKESHRVGIYKKAVQLQEKTITENGEYTADDGFDALGKVLVEVASSGGSKVLRSLKTFSGNGTHQVTVEHGLGVTPDIALCFCSTSNSTASSIVMVIGSRKAVYDLDMGLAGNRIFTLSSSKNFHPGTISGSCIDSPDGTYFYDANSQTISIQGPGTNIKFTSGQTYYLYCFAGLI